MCPVFAVSPINHFDTSRSPIGSHVQICYVPFRLFGLLLYCAQISLLSWTYFFQNKVLKAWHSLIIILCVSDVYSMLTCIENQNCHQTLHFSVEVVALILIHLDYCTVLVHVLSYFLETEVMCCLRFPYWCCLLWRDTMQSPKKYQCLKEDPSSISDLEGRGTIYLQNVATFLPHYMASYFRNRMQLAVCCMDIQFKPAVSCWLII